MKFLKCIVSIVKHAKYGLAGIFLTVSRSQKFVNAAKRGLQKPKNLHPVFKKLSICRFATIVDAKAQNCELKFSRFGAADLYSKTLNKNERWGDFAWM
jgi:hypothetical protein